MTFILYSGARLWDGPRSLHGILDFTDIPQRLREMVPDYRINLIEIRKWKDTSVWILISAGWRRTHMML